MSKNPDLKEIRAGLAAGRVVPYLGPGMLDLVADCPVPDAPLALVQQLAAKVTVPHKVRNNLTAAAQFIENFKHRKTITSLMSNAFHAQAMPSALHNYIAATFDLPLVVAAWYDNAMQAALAVREDWGMVQGVSQAEHFGTWVKYFDRNGAPATEADAQHWPTVLYQPLGSVSPANNFLVSDSDYVEVLTEIDIQTPIPPVVQRRRSGRHFLFLGCRFGNQLERTFARQITKRSSDRHWAVLPGELTRNEARFLAEQRIQRIDLGLAEFAALLQEVETETVAATG
jgi:hypothetical protein